jgi:hypothetical protein
MNKKSPPSRRFAICVCNEGYPVSLEVRKIYRVVADPTAVRHRMIRITDESGEDYLYPRDFFILVSLPASVRQALLHTA